MQVLASRALADDEVITAERSTLRRARRSLVRPLQDRRVILSAERLTPLLEIALAGELQHLGLLTNNRVGRICGLTLAAAISCRRCGALPMGVRHARIALGRIRIRVRTLH